jgi:hypothetical protein
MQQSAGYNVWSEKIALEMTLCRELRKYRSRNSLPQIALHGY